MYKTHHCNQLNSKNLNQEVRLIGWIQSIRNHGGLIFVDLRDREGIIQIVFNPQNNSLIQEAYLLKPESVIEITGVVNQRPEATINKSLVTGYIEILAKTMIIHNIAKTLPFPLEDSKADLVSEDLKLRYRYLDLRRPKLQNILRIRHKTARIIHDYLDNKYFTEVDMPTLFKSTSEGAREFLIPSRMNPLHFYALTQSPQQYKQMLMVAGIEKYYSFAKCYRDEDLRSDRQLEFIQLDIELSFITCEDIYTLIEELLSIIWKKILNIEIKKPFVRISFQDAMNFYGSDKPDTRFDIKLTDVSIIFEQSSFSIFKSTLSEGGIIKAINAKKLSDITQKEMKTLDEIAKSLGSNGLAYIKVLNNEWKSPIVKFLSQKERLELQKVLNIEEGDLIFFVANKREQACKILGRIRLEVSKLLIKRKKLIIPKSMYNFLWVVDFPLVTYDEDLKKYVSSHHPFTSPVLDDIPLLKDRPQDVRGQHYDIVINGVELGGGSIRIHQNNLQENILRNILNISQNIIDEQFGYMLEAFKFGAPPHGGIALGFDRLISILVGSESIRDVIAFPKTQKGQDLMSKSPGKVDKKQLDDLNISLI